VRKRPTFARSYSARRKRRILGLFAVLVVAAAAWLFSDLTAGTYARAQHAALRQTAAEAHVLHEHAAKTLETATALLVKIGDELERVPEAAGDAAVAEVLAQARIGRAVVPSLRAVVFHRLDGRHLADAGTLAHVRPPVEHWFAAAFGHRDGYVLAAYDFAALPLRASVLDWHESYLRPYRASIALRATVTIVGLAVLLGFAAFVHRQVAWLGRLDALRVRQRRRMLAAQRSLHTVINAMPAIVNAKDLDGRYTLVNEFAARLFGVSQTEAIGRRIEDLTDAQFAEEVRARERKAMADGVIDSREDTFFIDGRPHSFYAKKVPLIGPDGKTEGVVTVAIDITELKAVERKSIAAETLLRAALDSIPEGFAVFDDNDRLVVANRTYAQIFTTGDDPNAIVGLTFADLVRASMVKGEPPEPGFEGEAWVAERVRRHLAANGEPRLLQVADGRWISTLERRVPGIGIVGFRADVTAAIETQMALRQARDAAESANRAKSQFLANMSGRHLVGLIGDVLDMSKIEAGGYTLSEGEMSVVDFARDLLRLMRGHAQVANVELALDIAPAADVGLYADSQALRQIAINLLSNAIKFSHAGGHVLIAVRRVADGLEFAVADNGIGIAPEALAHVTEPFRQADGIAGKFGGTGLGLSISKRLAELHGGALRIESTLGVGTVATVWLPTSRLRAVAAPLRAAAR